MRKICLILSMVGLCMPAPAGTLVFPVTGDGSFDTFRGNGIYPPEGYTNGGIGASNVRISKNNQAMGWLSFYGATEASTGQSLASCVAANPGATATLYVRSSTVLMPEGLSGAYVVSLRCGNTGALVEDQGSIPNGIINPPPGYAGASQLQAWRACAPYVPDSNGNPNSAFPVFGDGIYTWELPDNGGGMPWITPSTRWGDVGGAPCKFGPNQAVQYDKGLVETGIANGHYLGWFAGTARCWYALEDVLGFYVDSARAARTWDVTRAGQIMLGDAANPTLVNNSLYVASDPITHTNNWLAIPVDAAFLADMALNPECKGLVFANNFTGLVSCNDNATMYSREYQAGRYRAYLVVGAFVDCNGNDIDDAADIAAGTSQDCNGNGIPDECEPDCNGNGIADGCDIASGTSQDCNHNGIPDECDIASGTSHDCNHNGIPDECDIASGFSHDCNGNGIPDECDIANGTSHDCNGNGIPDECDIANGTSRDLNGDGIPDECQLDVRVVPVAVLIDPNMTSDVRTTLPTSISGVVRGGRYYVEVWASDVGGTDTGLTGLYVDVSIGSGSSALSLEHGEIFTTFASGTIQAGHVDEFGGAALPSGGGIAPEWVRLGWIEMGADVDTPACTIALQPSSSGVGALNRGLIEWAFIELGSLALQIQAPARSYDLDHNNTINIGDLSLFAGSWLKAVPPGNTLHDFDCDGFVGVGDLSWFATGWNKLVTNPSILYPPCGQTLAARIPFAALEGVSGPSFGGPAPLAGTWEPDIAFQLAVVSSASTSDYAAAIPASLEVLTPGQVCYVEVWVSDVGAINTGLTSAYVDLHIEGDIASVTQIRHGSVLTVFPSGTASPVGIDEFGGSALPGGVGIEPQWVRVGYAKLTAGAAPNNVTFSLSPSSTGVAALARGAISWDNILLDTLAIINRVPGDVDGDGHVDVVDLLYLVDAFGSLTGDANYDPAADFNSDGSVDVVDLLMLVDNFGT